ncbi:MAG: methionine gamma-lyase family protein, partial [Clostridia bacterium]|nr:methionine gamma-lyase family protein [Clostridia bacterium]
MVSKTIIQFINRLELALQPDFLAIDDISLYNQNKVLSSFIKNKVALRHFSATTGYGYGDEGRETLCNIFADVFKSESAIVSSHILSGTHAISLVLFSLLRPGNTMLSITGAPYDTLKGVISGNEGSLKDFNINYKQIDLDGSEFNKNLIKDFLIREKPEMVYMQRSRGYTARNPVSIKQ